MLIFLAVGAVWDVRSKQIPVIYLIAGTCGAAGIRMISKDISVWIWGTGLLIGIVFLILSRCTNEAIGYGDSWMILNLGIFLGIWRMMILLIGSFFTAFIATGIGILLKRIDKKTRISFFPFLLLGYVGALLW